MMYPNTVKGKFLDRPNRFVAHVELNGGTETVHVKNTGRCRELLLPGVPVVLARADNPNRKTQYDLIAVRKNGLGWVNMDSQAPNAVVLEWLKKQEFDRIRPETVYGDSRIDFYMEKGRRKYLLEVKGCTLEIGGVGYFPDAPTERGRKHLLELAQARSAGYAAAVLFLVQRDDALCFSPNRETDPAFADALAEAAAAGVEVLCFDCEVTADSMTARSPVPVKLN